MDSIDKKIFIIGTGRCGTGWIGRWIAQHPEVFGSHETHFFSIISPLINKSWNQGIKTWISEEKIIEEIRNFSNQIFGQCKHRKTGENHMVEHSPKHYEVIDFIKKIYNDAFFVHIYRDGRQVVESWHYWDDDYSKFIKLWVKIMKDAKSRTSDPFVLHVKYEDLIKDPSKSKEITSFLGISHHKDIDVWEFPVNSRHHQYNENRWKSLSSNIKECFKTGEMKEMLDYFGYK